MKLAILCSLLLPAVTSTYFGSISAVITHNDVPIGGLKLTNLTAGSAYRVYAVYDSTAQDTNYVDAIDVSSSDGPAFSVSKLAGEVNFLSDENILIAPIAIKVNADSGIKPVRYTIYIVSNSTPPLPVIGLHRSDGNGTFVQNQTGVAILSAENFFRIDNIDPRSMNVISVKPTGYDTNSGYDVLKVTKAGTGSGVLISGPIATVYNPEQWSARFAFDVKGHAGGRLSDDDRERRLKKGASITILSSGWIDGNESYNVDYHEQTRYYTFGRDTSVVFESFFDQSANGTDSIGIHCDFGDRPGSTFDLSHMQTPNKEVCFEMHLVGVEEGGPQFMIKIKSGALSSSLFVLVIVSVVRRLFQ